MALISKIRRNFWIVLILLGLALASFILMDVMGSNSAGGLLNQTNVATIDGEKVDYFEYGNIERALFSGGQDPYASRASLWDYVVNDKIASKIADKLGLGVGKEELDGLLFDFDKLSPVIRNAFTNQQTGMPDFEQLNQIKEAIKGGQELNDQFKFTWAAQEKQVQSVKVQEKISNLVAKAMYTPTWLVDLTTQLQTETTTGKMLKVPFEYIDEKSIKLTDEDYKTYLNENKGKFTQDEETRILDYVGIDVIPTLADSTVIFERLKKLEEDFKVTTNDSLFAVSNNGLVSPVYSGIDDFQGALKDVIKGLNPGQVTAPFIEGTNYFVAKLIDKKMMPDSVKARHILKSTQGGVSVDKARAQIDSIKNLIVSGKQRFDSLALKTSEDPGSASLLGDLGTFAQGRMVAEFNEACFNNSQDGGLYTVTTQFGVHLIEVQKRIFSTNEPKYKAAIISEPIIPSQATQDAALDKLNKILMDNRTLESMKKAAEKAGLTVSTSAPLKLNDYIFESFGGGQTSRDIVKWAHNANVGEVAPMVYEYSDNVNYYSKAFTLVGLKQIDPAGLMSVSAAKATINTLVLNKKRGEEIIKKLKGSTIEQMASAVGIEVEDIASVNYVSGSAELAGEPKAIATMTGLKQGKTSKPIIGSTGVYVVKSDTKTPGIANNNMPTMRQSITSNNRMMLPYTLWPAIKTTTKIKDNRSRFY
jgi:peptidyl-prolyl cis-trans isomerase D